MASQSQPDSIPFPLTETDRQYLAAGDAKYKPHTWDDVRKIIADDNLSVLKRKPSDLQRYIVWTNQIKQQYGSIINFVCKERLHWQPLPDSTSETGPLFEIDHPIPFASTKDYEILRNDWPYGLSPNIVHLIVWLKTRIPVVPPEGYLTPESRTMIEDFVQKTFTQPLKEIGQGNDQVQWFKNWVSLQSVPGLDHVHVLVRDVPDDMMEKWTANAHSGP